MAIIDELFVLLGFKIDDSGLKKFQAQAQAAHQSVLSMGEVLTGAFAAFATKAVADIGSTFEQNRLQIAGFLSGLGLTSDFNAGLTQAEKTIQSITKAAARLPGEAEDYIQVFKTALPFVQAAIPGGSIEQITDFTNQLTAVGKTFGIDAGTIAHEADMLLGAQGRASVRFPLFVQLQNFMRKLPGQAKLTAESFNAMSQPERLRLMAESFKLLGPMLDASANSFDAMWGAAVSGAKQLIRLGTGKLFEGMKKALDALNGAFFDTNGNLTEFGKDTVGVLKKVGDVISRLVTVGIQLAKTISQSPTMMTALKVAAVALGAAIGGLAFGKLVPLIGSLLNLQNILKGGLIAALVLVAEDIWGFYHGADSVTGLLVKEFPNALKIAGVGLGVLAAAFVAAKIASAAAALATALSWAAALAPILAVIAAVVAAIKLFTDLKNHKGFFNDRVRALGQGVADKLHGMLEGLGIHEDRIVLGHDQEVHAAMAETFGHEEAARKDREARGLPGPGPWAPDYAPADKFSMFKWESPAVGGAKTVINNAPVTHNVGKVEINTNDAAEMAKEYDRRVIRNAQSRVGL